MRKIRFGNKDKENSEDGKRDEQSRESNRHIPDHHNLRHDSGNASRDSGALMTGKDDTPDQEPIHLDRDQLAYYVHLGATTDLDCLEQDNPKAFRVIEWLGLFFAANPEMADYAIDIDEIILTPQPNGAPPLAALQVTYKRQTHHLETGPDGRLPSLPFGTKKRRKKRWKKRKLQ